MPIKFENVNYIYNPNTSFEHEGLKNVSFEIRDNSFTAIVGHTGSGKSTLLQHFDALLKPSSGTIKIDDFVIDSQTTNKNLKPLRKKVGIVFQFSENQLFAETVVDDVMFGPINFGVSKQEAEERAKHYIKLVGLSDDILKKSPFELSGGQMRRVAIAGVLSYEPDILCLDEPAAGLDPAGREEIMQIFKEYQNSGHTIVFITHEMEDVARYAEDVLILQDGELIRHTSPQELFSDPEWLREHYLSEPDVLDMGLRLKKAGVLDALPLNLDDLVTDISEKLGGKVNE